MKEMNLCNGCFYAGAADGFKPECNCQNRIRYEEMEEKQEKVTADAWDTIYPMYDTFSETVKTGQQRQERRISRRKANKKANQMLPIVEAKYRNLSSYATKSEYNRLENKCRNAEKKATRNEQVTVTISFPTSIEKVQGRGISNLKKLFSAWADNPEKMAGSETKIAPKIATEIETECEKAMEMLETAKRYNGEVVALYKEQNKICMTMGFYTKKDLAEFKRKMEKAS